MECFWKYIRWEGSFSYANLESLAKALSGRRSGSPDESGDFRRSSSVICESLAKAQRRKADEGVDLPLIPVISADYPL